VKYLSVYKIGAFFMFSIFKWLLIINIIVFVAWPFGRGYLPESTQDSAFAVAANYVTEPVEHLSGYKGNLIKVDKYNGRMIELNGKILSSLLTKIRERRMKAVVFFYDPNKLTQRVSLSSLNKIALPYKSLSSVSIIPVAIGSREELNRFVDYLPEVNTPLIFVPKEKLSDVQNVILTLRINVDSEPVIAFIDENGMLKKQEFSYFMSNKIDNFLR
jgi:hypothetical protein